MKRLAIFLSYFLTALPSIAQYAPQAGISGSSALHKSSTQIVGWANYCTLQRGWMDIANPSLGRVYSGDSSLAMGAADNLTVSLGDSGIAVLTFPAPITNGPGADFAVFENGFLNAANSEEAFLELAFVEVSSDGVHFFRFPAISYTQDTQQITGTGAPGTGDYINARHIHHLAGKYIANNGTPFDLEDLQGIEGLDIQRITHVRLVDVIGDLGSRGSLDSNNHYINDPYPTPFPTGGFDLDAVAVLHQLSTAVPHTNLAKVVIYPNPVADILTIENNELSSISIVDALGRNVFYSENKRIERIDVSQWQQGMYFITISNKMGNLWAGQFVKTP